MLSTLCLDGLGPLLSNTNSACLSVECRMAAFPWPSVRWFLGALAAAIMRRNDLLLRAAHSSLRAGNCPCKCPPAGHVDATLSMAKTNPV